MSEESYIQQLASYIKKNLTKGYTLESLKTALEQQDYSRTSIDRAIKLVNQQLAASAPQMAEKPVIRYQAVPVSEIVEERPKKKSFFKKLFNL